MKHRISVYIRSYEVSPSGYYRVLQYTNNMDGKFVIHNVIPPSYYKLYLTYKSKKQFFYVINILTYVIMYFRLLYFVLSDLCSSMKYVVISRGLIPRFFPPILRFLFSVLLSKVSLIWDFDDDILCSNEISLKEFSFLSSFSTSIIVTHRYLKEQISEEYHEKVIIMPTTDGDFQNLDIIAIQQERLRSFKNEIQLVWLGTAVNLIFLERSLASIDKIAGVFYKQFSKKIILNIICSQPVSIDSLCFLEVNNIKWTKMNAIDTLLTSHVGIMPLEHSKYTLGKGGFKLVQYMAMSLPVIASNVGFNKDIVNEKFGELISELDNVEEWYEALCNLVINESIYISKSKKAFEEWENQFSYNRNLHVWKTLLKI